MNLNSNFLNLLKIFLLKEWFVIQLLKQKKGKWVFPKDIIEKDGKYCLDNKEKF